MTLSHKILQALNKFIRDKHGHIVMWQTPNVPLIAWFVFMLATHFVHREHLHTTVRFISAAALVTWAYLETTQGASYFRRTLGLVILLGTLLSF